MRRVSSLVIAFLAAFSLTLTVAPDAAAKPPKPAPAPTQKYVALGDSFASGAGLTPYSDAACYRSATQAYPTLLAGTSWKLTFVACTGATTQSVIDQQLPKAPVLDAKVVTLTVGGNDVGFASVLSDCVDSAVTDGCSAAMKTQTATALDNLPGKLATTLTAVKTAYPNATIHLTGYPRMFGSFSGQCVVGSNIIGNLWINQADGVWLNEVADALNTKLKDAATAAGTSVVFDDVAAKFATHGRCDTSTPWVNGVVLKSFFSATATERSFHPTATGQKSGYQASIKLA